ncbi:MAG: CTP synthase [Candidatus Aminicenantaceae bacterium]
MSKFIFVTGGVLSALGKGIAAASVGMLMESHGYKITLQKFDPYLNVDPGTMSPYQHGEVYVTDDGAETDLDLGHYERFTSTSTNKNNNWTAGKIYESIIRKERRGDFLGKTVQVIPHVTDEIKKAFHTVTDNNDIIIVEIGGTVGDIESLPFLESIRQMRLTLGKENTIFIHVTLVPFIKTSGELKTKPTQHSVRELRAIGIQPDIILCRTEKSLSNVIKSKISLFTNVPLEAVITAKDVDYIYEIPILFAKEELDTIILKLMNLPRKKKNLSRWKALVKNMKYPHDKVEVALVGKYAELQDSYISLREALSHGGIAHKLKVNISWIEAEDLEKGKLEDILKDKDGILVPGGFGVRGIEGKIKAVTFAREKKIPFFGICLGMQCAAVEYARNLASLSKANSTEFDPNTPHKIFFKWRELKGVKDMGGTMRLGSYRCRLEKNSLAYKIYNKETIYERHRHRYEFNPEYEKKLANGDLIFPGKNPENNLVEIMELKNHPWFLGCQFHPEFKSKPLEPHPLFKSFIGASYAHHLKRNKNNSKG